jgi:hypothetical protein
MDEPCRQPARTGPTKQADGAGGYLPADSEALDDLDCTVKEMTNILRFYESALAELDIRLPYHRHDAG